MRLDVWLWRARFFKTRSLAAAAISDQGFRIERQGNVRRVSKPAIDVAPGDVLAFASNGRTILVRIRSLPARRGPAPEAATSYDPLLAAADGGLEAISHEKDHAGPDPSLQDRRSSIDNIR